LLPVIFHLWIILPTALFITNILPFKLQQYLGIHTTGIFKFPPTLSPNSISTNSSGNK
jgi:hypothetical protein